jgi:hypothetical protein
MSKEIMSIAISVKNTIDNTFFKSGLSLEFSLFGSPTKKLEKLQCINN